MLSHVPGHQREVLRGILFMCVAATFVFPLINLCAKYLTADYAVLQIVWARYTGHFVYTLLIFGPSRGRRLFQTKHLGLQLARSAILPGSSVAYFMALRHISLPMAAAINFTTPIVVTLLAIPLLNEQVGWRRWFAIFIGFAGVLIVIRPGLGAVHPSALLVLVTVACFALYQILTRKVARDDAPETSVTYSALGGCVLSSISVPLVWQTPQSLLPIALFLAIGLVGAGGHFLLTKAFEHAPASVVSPLAYLQLIGAALFGYWVFGDIADRWVWIGATLIVTSGLYITYRESLRSASTTST